MPSLTSSMRRDSTSTVSSTPSLPSVTVNTSTPAFRALRSLLPFAPNKPPTTISSNVSNTENAVSSVFKTSFAASFGSLRRKSISKDSRSSISQEEPMPPVISIGPDSRAIHEHLEEPPIRRSLSLSELDQPVTNARPLSVPDDETRSLGSSQKTIHAARTPSPLIPSTADLSTILEADTSRDRLSATSSRATSMSPAIPSSQLGVPGTFGGSPTDPHDSFLHFSPAVARHHELDEDEYPFQPEQDASTGTVLIHSANNSAHLFRPDRTFNGKNQRDSNNSLNLDALDPDLRALLSPNRCDKAPGSSATTPSVLTPSASPGSQYFTPSVTSTEATPRDRFGASSAQLPSSLSRLRAAGRDSFLPRLKPSHKANTSESSASTSAPNSPVTPTFRNNGSTASLARSTSSRMEATPLAKPTKKRDSFLRNTHNRSMSTSGPPTARKFTPQTHRHVSQAAKGQDSRRASISGIPRLSSPFKPHLQRSTTSTTNVIMVPDSPEASEFGERAQRLPSSSLPRPASAALSATLRQGPSRPSIDSTRSEILQTRGHGNDWTITPRSQQARAPEMMRSVSGGFRERSGTTSTTDSRGRFSVQMDEGPCCMERSTSMQEQYKQLGHGRRGPSRDSSRTPEEEVATSPAMRALRSPALDDDGGRRATSSLSGRLSSSGRVKTEWLGPRTIKAFQAAGLMGEQDGGFTPGSVPAESNMRPLGSFRSSADHGLRSPSRTALSESESGGRRSTYSYNVQESPTYTTSSGSGRDRERERLQDTPRSSSTAPTSISGWNRFAESPEIQELKDRHALETGALLSALSDSQRVARVLRSENDELRGRLERIEVLERENVNLKGEVVDLEAQLGLYKREVSMLLARARENQMRSNTNSWNTPRQRSGLGTTSPIAGMLDDEDEQDTVEETENTYVIKTPIRPHQFNEQPSSNDFNPDFLVGDLNDSNPLVSGKLPAPNFSSTPAATQKSTQRRRLSTTSSVFPIPPANMTMLLHDQGPGYDSEQESMFSNSSNPLTSSTAPMPIARSTPQRQDSPRVRSISPSSTSFSMFTSTGSPSTLSLRPEHELHLGDLESLDLGIRSGDDSEDIDDINISQLLRG